MPVTEGRLEFASKHVSSPWAVATALAAIRGGTAVRSEVQGRLVPVLGNDIAFEVGVRAGGMARLVERVRLTGRDEGWQLWDLGVDDVLRIVPVTHRDAARVALAGPRPPRASSWEESVQTTPTWLAAPLAWPGHVCVVQRREGRAAAAVHKTSARMGMQDVTESLTARLVPALGADAAARAAHAGARRRQLVRQAVREDAAAGTVTVWTLWQVPIEEVLDVLSEPQRSAARGVLEAP